MTAWLVVHHPVYAHPGWRIFSAVHKAASLIRKVGGVGQDGAIFRRTNCRFPTKIMSSQNFNFAANFLSQNWSFHTSNYALFDQKFLTPRLFNNFATA